MLAVAGQMDLPVLADDATVSANQDRRVVVPGDAVLDRELCVAKMKSDRQLTRRIKERLRRRVRHRLLEERVDVFLPLEIPMREECRQRAFGKHDEIAAMRLRTVHH